MGTNAIITFEAPENVQLSKPPLGGHFIIQCKTLGGSVSFTEEIAVGASWLTVENKINTDCFMMNDKVRVYDSWPCKYKENCFGYKIRFSGIETEQGQYEIITGVKSPLTGDTDVTKPLTYTKSETQAQGTTIFYDTIPFEMV